MDAILNAAARHITKRLQLSIWSIVGCLTGKPILAYMTQFSVHCYHTTLPCHSLNLCPLPFLSASENKA